MKKIPFLLLLLLPLTLLSQNVVAIIIDGARYTETFGDPQRRFIPYMDSLSHYGTIVDGFYNNHYTYTSQAIPVLWTGTWVGTRDTVYNGQSTQYTLAPSVFEYFRKQLGQPDTQAIYVLMYVSSLWLQSFTADYGPDYWPYTVSQGDNDIQVVENAKQLLARYHPRFMWIYLADVDHAGHTGVWETYTGAIKTADSLVNVIWQTLQSDPFYAGNTYLFVTNDHGRHDDAHGGFQNHGCSCEGCRHIMFLALGPEIKNDYVSPAQYELQDFAVTLSYVLGVDPEYADGVVIEDIFKTAASVSHLSDMRIWFAGGDILILSQDPGTYDFQVFSLSGDLIFRKKQMIFQGKNRLPLPRLEPGIYVLRYTSSSGSGVVKFAVY